MADRTLLITLLKVLARPLLRKTARRCVGSIFYNFFFLQYKAALLRRIPVSRVDHPLDAAIPFTPGRVGIYLDFTAFWIRIIGFTLDHYGEAAVPVLADFIDSMGRVYRFAAEVYTRNLSTTMRPRYLAMFRFMVIHAVDPHLMCIPSLHVMVVIRTYTQFARMIRTLGDEKALSPRVEAVRRGALAITEAILYVKQHSVNCIPAAMYAMTCFDRASFPPEEGEAFAAELLAGAEDLSPPGGGAVREYITGLYRRFLREGAAGPSWEKPLLDFLAASPRQ
jgi:hypothetical protein